MANSSPLPSSSPSSHKTSPHTQSLAFLVHSPTTVANSLPPDVDNKSLARQKRRRTSKEDEDILKAEYQKNSKPDKATRLKIVGQVALGEKEVQIWFQNKRQNERRRSRPMDSSSTPSFGSSSSNMSDSPTEDEVNARDVGKGDKPLEQAPPRGAITEAAAEAPEEAPEEAKENAKENAREAVALSESTVETALTPSEDAEAASQVTENPITVASTDPQTIDTVPTEANSFQSGVTLSEDASQPRTSWISNRRSASFRYSEDYAAESITFPSSFQTAQIPEGARSTTKALKRTHSFVRISTNEDGTARIVTDLDKTPSPPHPKTNLATFSRAAGSLRRSYSAAGLNERLTAAAAQEERSPKAARTSSSIGRSRDSRAWEFWCDPESRSNTSLTTRAEQERSGSAADAIGLLRANRKILSQNHARQNTPVLSRRVSGKASNENGIKKSRGPIQRASTTHGRLQSKSLDSSSSDELPQTESDKENWEPDVKTSSRRTPRPAKQRRILGENTEIMSQSASLGAFMAKEKGGRKGSDPEVDEELRRFMRSASGKNGTASTTVSSAEEAGCVEGLLKLSQAQWR